MILDCFVIFYEDDDKIYIQKDYWLNEHFFKKSIVKYFVLILVQIQLSVNSISFFARLLLFQWI